MAVDRAQAARDLNAKLRLEAVLRPRVHRIQNATSLQVVQSLASTGSLPDVAGIEANSFEPVLRQHYDDVSRVFDHHVSSQLPDDVAMTDQEKAALAAALAAFFNRKSAEEAGLIGQTSADQASRSVVLANGEARRLREKDGQLLSMREKAVIAGTFFARHLAGRTSGIVIGATQLAAESSKLQESRILLGDDTPLDQTSAQGDAEHEWVTQGDDRVRVKPFNHRAADHQRRVIGTPFNVSGQRLLYPGDTSLGASLGNVRNCRCSAIPDVAAVASARRAA